MYKVQSPAFVGIWLPRQFDTRPFSNLLLESSAKHFEQLLWASEPSALLWSLEFTFIFQALTCAPKADIMCMVTFTLGLGLEGQPLICDSK